MLQRYNKKMNTTKKMRTIFLTIRFISWRSHYIFTQIMPLLIINTLWFSLYCKPSKSGKTGDTGEQTFHLTASKNESGDIRVGNVYIRCHETNSQKSTKFTYPIYIVFPVMQRGE